MNEVADPQAPWKAAPFRFQSTRGLLRLGSLELDEVLGSTPLLYPVVSSLARARPLPHPNLHLAGRNIFGDYSHYAPPSKPNYSNYN